jgi:endonuclease/exonuclease/phosphatase family metal-dependent hydrolase
MKLRVATYNIHKGVTGIRRVPRIHDVKLALNSIDADIVFLQEVQDRNETLRHHANYPSARQLDFLATGGYEHLAYGMNAVYPHGHHGNAILSRHAIGNYTNHDISDHALEKRGMLHAVSKVTPPRGRKARDVHLICVHFGLIKRSRVRQATALADFIDQEIPAEAPLIVAGDFNDWRRRANDILWREAGLREIFVTAYGEPAKTFPAIFPVLSLDRIYVRNCSVHLPVVLPRRPWSHLSDHAPLVAEIHL